MLCKHQSNFRWYTTVWDKGDMEERVFEYIKENFTCAL